MLGAALDEFSGTPFSAASLNRIVKAAGIAKGSFYQYFTDMMDLYRHLVLDELVQRKLAYFAQGAQPPEDGDIFDQMAFFAVRGIRFGLEHPRAAAAARQLWHRADPALGPLEAELRALSHRNLRRILAGAQAAGEVRPELDLDHVVPVVEVFLKQGLDAAVQARLGVDLLSLITGAGPRPTDAELEALTSAHLDLLRRAIGTGRRTGHRLDLDGIGLPTGAP